MVFLTICRVLSQGASVLENIDYSRMPYSRAPTLFRSIYSQDRKNSSCVNVALEKCKKNKKKITIEAAIIKGAI